METRLERKANGMYQIVWYDEQTRHTRRQSLCTKDSSQAKKRFSLWLIEDEADQLGGISVKEVLAAYDRHIEKNVVDKQRERTCMRWLLEYFSDMSVTNITVEDVTDGYIVARNTAKVGRKACNETARRELTTLIAALSHAVKIRLLRKQDVPYIPLPIKAPPKERWLTDDECSALLDAAEWDGRARKRVPDRRCARFVRMAFATGARKEAIESLQWSQVDFATGLIKFQQPDRQKTKKKRPTIPIPDSLLPHLKKWAASKNSLYVIGGKGAIRKTFESACERAGLDDVSPHTLRHTWATHAALNGVSLLQISKVLGNSLAVVEKIYAHLNPDFLKDAVNHKTLGVKRG